jgi:putative ABC transport system permease protein
MPMLAAVRSVLRGLLRRTRFEREMSEELRFHVEAYTEDLVRAGVPWRDAQRRARVAFGGLEGLKDELRQARGLRLIDEFRQDTRYAVRQLRRGRGLAVVAVLAVGVGVNLAVFSVIHATLLRPLPHPDPDRLVAISSFHLELGREHQTSPLDFFDFEQRSTSFARLAAYYPPGFTLTGSGQAERVAGGRASSGIFDVFGVRPALGRGFLREEDKAGARVAVIGHGVWSRRYQQDPNVIGKAILLSGAPYTIIGVLPEGFHSPALWPRMPEVWVPLGVDPNVGRRDARMLRVIGRLRPDVSIDGARAELDVIAKALAAAYPDTNAGTGVTIVSLLEQLTRDARPSLFMLAAAVAALLLVACGNAAGLLIGGTLVRQQEFATRLALGAGRGRIVRQIVAENVVIGLLAAVSGFWLALLASDALIAAAAAAGLPRAADIRIGVPTLVIGAVLSLACTSACALAAGVETTRGLVSLRIRRGAGVSTPVRQRSRALLIGLQAALSLALLAGAGLLVRSFHTLQSTDPGFDTRDVLTTRLSPPAARYPAGAVLSAFYDRAVEQVKALPGVKTAAVVDWLPLSGHGASVPFKVAGAGSGATAMAELRAVSHDYFQTLRVPLVGGREFDRRDAAGTPRVVVINSALARAHFGTANPVGRHLTLDRGEPIDVEIVGLTNDVRELSLRIPPGPGIYVPKTQLPWIRHETRELVIRASHDAAQLVPAIETVVRALEPDMPRAPVQRMEALIAGSLARPQAYAWAVSAFALTAVVLAAFGIYGTVASAVAQCRREIGVRLALGATRADVLARAARYGAVPTLSGLLAGVPLALVAGQLLRQQLVGVGPADWLTLVLVATFMATVAMAAALVPAIRATRIDPVETLRHEAAE